MVRSPLTAARATFALKADEWFRRGRLLMVSPVHGDYRRCQAEIPLIILCRFPGPALYTLIGIGLLVAVALVSNREQRKGAWLLAAVVIVLVIIADRIFRSGARPD